MKFPCPFCRNNIEVTPEWFDLTIDCPHIGCGKSIVVPTPEATIIATPVKNTPEKKRSPAIKRTAPRNSTVGEYRHSYGGMTRAAYWISSFALVILLACINFLIMQGNPRNIVPVLLIVYGFVGLIQLGMAWYRFQNPTKN